MAKKVLTPEQQEIKAIKKEKRSQNWTKFWAILLAFVLVAGIAYMGKSQGAKNSEAVGTEVNGGTVSGGDSTGSTDNNTTPVTPGADTSDDTPAADNNGGSTEAPAADNNGGSTEAPAANDAAAVAAAINKATGAAVSAKAGYDWERHCQVKDIDVGALTGALNKLIGSISSNKDDNLNTVVGGFLGNGDRKETVKKGETLATKVVTKDDGSTETYYHGTSYTLKATNLKAEDIKNLKVNGDKYEFDLPDCQNPDRNGNNALSRFTNDVVIREEIEKEIQGFTDKVSITGLQANYKNIHATVTIKDGKLVELTYSFYADAELGVKLGLTITGTGNLTCNAKYSNFKY